MAALAWIAMAASVAAFPMPLVLPERIAPELLAAAARLDELTRSLTGNVAELRAAERISHHRLQTSIAACMQTAGRPYSWAPPRNFYADFTDADLGYGTGRVTIVDSLTEHGRRHMLNELAYARLEGTSSGTVRPADRQTYIRCRMALRRQPSSDLPPGAGLAGFGDLLEPAYRDPRVMAAWAGYRPCMRRQYGFEVGDRSHFLFQQRFSRKDAPIAGRRPASAAWTRGVADMEAAFAADADCRRPAYVLAMRHVADGLEAWEKRHRAEIGELRAMWRQQVTEAARLPSSG
ncbi:MAG TPA: hypothetical protein VFH03_27325 [Actinoplanes sp.]|nr:hypothetical protein [Actinoplanes sp.]